MFIPFFCCARPAVELDADGEAPIEKTMESKIAASAIDCGSRPRLGSKSKTCLRSDAVRTVCKYGSKCFRKNPQHTQEEAHPSDGDYLASCRAAGVEPEFVSIRSLFDWCDPKGIGKAARAEVQSMWPKIQRLGERVGLLDDALWETMDFDGNGYVNFSEFAEFTTKHKFDLPLGLDSLFGLSSDAALCCGVHDCTCKGFVARRKKCKYGAECYQTNAEHLSQFCHPKDSEWSIPGKSDPSMCICGHKQRLHRANPSLASAVPYPKYWENKTSSGKEFSQLVALQGDDLAKFQDLLNATYSDVTTRDRVTHCKSWMVPRNFKLCSVERNENSKLWMKYMIRKAELQTEKESDEYKLYDTDSTKVWESFLSNLELNKEINEWYLFHGTSGSAARNICATSFKMRLAGSSTGTLYGKGTYMSESITKADEYAKEEGSTTYSDGFFTVLLCRVLGGRVNYCDEKEPDPAALTESCMEGPYDCILGDRKKTSNTYREFIIFDSENVYPEFILKYRRGEMFYSPSAPVSAATMATTVKPG